MQRNKEAQQNGSLSVQAATPDVAATPGDGDAQSGSAAMAFAKTVSSATARDEDERLTETRLLNDYQLQRSLLEANPSLKQRFNDSLKEKPADISMSQFSMQFWTTRVHLLRAHAAEKGQALGATNVLSEIKPITVSGEGTRRLNLSKEQISVIFKQHPIVRRAYNDAVPKLSDSEFWQRFFSDSKLLKSLKGERILDSDPPDAVFDKYLNFDEEAERAKQLALAHVPHIIDLEGNEQNHSQQKGNRPDYTMRPSTHKDVPIMRALNDMSEKMLRDVQPSDGEAHAPVGMDEETFNQLQLQDLQRRSDDNRIMLQIKDQSSFLSGEQSSTNGLSAEAALFAKQNPKKVLNVLNQDLQASFKTYAGSYGIDLERTIGVDDDSDSDSDDNEAGLQKKQLRVGSKAARTAATRQIMSLIRTRRAQTSSSDYASFDAPTGTFAPLSTAAAIAETGLSPQLLEQLTMTHNTTVEFLHYFWSVFLSGDPDRAGELATLAQTLDKSEERIRAVAEAAETEREGRIAQLRAENERREKRTGRKYRLDLGKASVGGGRKEVEGVVEPTLKAVRLAARRYRTEVERQTKAASLAGA